MESFLKNIIYPKDLYVDVRIEERCYEFLEIEKKHMFNPRFMHDSGAYIRVFDGVCWYEKYTEDITNINDIICELSHMAYKNKRIDDIVAQLGLSTYIKATKKSLGEHWNQCELEKNKFIFSDVILEDMKAVISKKNAKKLFVSNFETAIYQESSWYGIDVDIYEKNYFERGSKVYRTFDSIFSSNALAEQLSEARVIKEQLRHSEESEWMKKVLVAPQPMSLLIHEVVGHMSECDLYDSYESMQKTLNFANEIAKEVNVVDVGVVNQVGGYLYDDEGIEKRNSYIVKNGIFCNALSDVKHGSAWGMPLTGNGRAVSIYYGPIIRMSNTYMLPGKTPLSALLKKIKKGILIEHIGSIENNVGQILLKHIRCRMIVCGEIKEPIIVKSYENSWYNFLNAICEISNEARVYASVLSGCDKGGQNGLLVSMGAPYSLLEF